MHWRLPSCTGDTVLRVYWFYATEEVVYVLRSIVGVVRVEGVADLERTPVESLDGQSVHGDPFSTRVYQ